VATGDYLYRIICADPPWPFPDHLPGPSRDAARNYKVLSLPEIEQFPLPPIADDALLFLCRVAAMGETAYRVMHAWGFEPECELVWLKRTRNGKRWFGMGWIVRAEHELCIIAKRGRPETQERSIRSVFEAECLRHSEKPEAFYRIERLAPGPYLELCARRSRAGWDCLGNQDRGGERTT
jgi:N6-adenosine-specific RNA methylase IME4